MPINKKVLVRSPTRYYLLAGLVLHSCFEVGGMTHLIYSTCKWVDVTREPGNWRTIVKVIFTEDKLRRLEPQRTTAAICRLSTWTSSFSDYPRKAEIRNYNTPSARHQGITLIEVRLLPHVSWGEVVTYRLQVCMNDRRANAMEVVKSLGNVRYLLDIQLEISRVK